MVPGSDVTIELIHAVAEETGSDAIELPPLYEDIDPEALDRLIERATCENMSVEFEYAECSVTISVDAGETSVRAEQLDTPVR